MPLAALTRPLYSSLIVRTSRRAATTTLDSQSSVWALSPPASTRRRIYAEWLLNGARRARFIDNVHVLPRLLSSWLIL